MRNDYEPDNSQVGYAEKGHKLKQDKSVGENNLMYRSEDSPKARVMHGLGPATSLEEGIGKENYELLKKALGDDK